MLWQLPPQLAATAVLLVSLSVPAFAQEMQWHDEINCGIFGPHEAQIDCPVGQIARCWADGFRGFGFCVAKCECQVGTPPPKITDAEKSCDGNAAGSVSISFDGTKFVVKNIGEKSVGIKFDLNPANPATLSLASGQVDSPKSLGNYITKYVNKCHASY